MPDSSPPVRMISTASARTSSEPRRAWRSSTTSLSGIRVLAQCTAPTPMKNNDTAMPMPRPSVDALIEAKSPSGRHTK